MRSLYRNFYLQLKCCSLVGYFSLFHAQYKKEKNKGITEYRFKIGVDKKSPNKSSSLQGKKIAIDPGHIGGPYAYLEKRYVDMKGSSIQFDEGTLAYQTALLLKDLLEKEGAAVLITKESMHQGVYAKDFWQWLQEEFPNTIERHLSSISNTKSRKAEKEKWLHNSSLSTIFRRWYNTLDLFARAKKINNFAPDITLIIHYNCGGRYDEVTGESIGTTHNNILMFIPGAFMKKEISKKENRLDFLRLSITDQLDESLLLAKEIARCTSKRLQVSLAGKESLKTSSIYASEGVFCRNLALTRLIHSPVCYGETLFQDNFEESKR